MSMSTALLSNGKTFEAPAATSLLDAAKAAGLVLEHSCRSGRCNSCKTRLLSGAVVPIKPDLSLSEAERAQGWILTCASAADGDIELDIEDLGLPADIVVKTLPSRIAALQRLAPDVLKVERRLPPSTAFHYLPGQYIDVIAKDGMHRSYLLAGIGKAAANLELHVSAVPSGKTSNY
jgi:CDP-4-dehydro-6-deoxyglucose reductase